MKFTIKEFFGKSGLTSTSANHIANMAKEFYRKLETEINSIKTFNEDVNIIGSSDSMRTVNGNTEEDINSIPEKLNKIADCKALIAYLREAIKERDTLTAQIRNYKDEEARSKVVRPASPEYITEKEVMASWSVGDLTKYYELEAKCATFGKYIHEDGTFNKARLNHHKTLQNPIMISGNGRDTIATKRTASVDGELVDKTFFALQAEYRKTQAELNSIKHDLETQINEDTIKKDAEYQVVYESYINELEKISTAEKLAKEEALKEVQKLKIMIPKHLKSIYDEIQSLSK